MSQKRLFSTCVTALFLIQALWSAGPASSAEPGEDGRAVLERTATFYRGLTSMSAEVEIAVEIPPAWPAIGEIGPFYYRFALEKPDRVAFLPLQAGKGAMLIQDGTQQFLQMGDAERYMLAESQPFEQLMAAEHEGIMVPGAELFLGLALDDDAPGALGSLQRVELLGEDAVDGTDCHHLRVEGAILDGELWLAKGDAPWIVRFHQAPPDSMAAAAAEPEAAFTFRPRMDYRFRDWEANPVLAEAFRIKPQVGFEQVERSDQVIGVSGSSGHDTVGKPAPEVRLQRLDGEALRLSSLRGKVVVLDFWASWCVPCLVDLPLVTRVTSEFVDRGVVFFAVNQAESPESITSFLNRRRLDPPVALDTNLNVSSAFRVGAIPHVVIIDREGMVRYVLVGTRARHDTDSR